MPVVQPRRLIALAAVDLPGAGLVRQAHVLHQGRFGCRHLHVLVVGFDAFGHALDALSVQHQRVMVVGHAHTARVPVGLVPRHIVHPQNGCHSLQEALLQQLGVAYGVAQLCREGNQPVLG